MTIRMKERPILFSAEMVIAILQGRKTQTRRALKHQPIDILPIKGDPGAAWSTLEQKEPEPKGKIVRCRYGKPGELLWVKETFRTVDGRIEYRADGDVPGPHWRPSIFMPRRLSRITLKILEVRAQRLQDISRLDAKAEGLTFVAGGAARYGVPGIASTWRDDPRESFRGLWEHVNGRRAWEANPLVWAVTFERC